MRRFIALAFGLAGLLISGVPRLAGQMNGPVVQTVAHPSVSHAARASAVHSAAPASQSSVRGPVAVGPRMINSHPSGIPGYSGVSAQSNYSPFIRSVNPTLAAMTARQRPRIDRIQSDSNLPARNEFARRRLALANDLSNHSARDYAVQPTAAMLAKRRLSEATLTTAPKNFDVDRPATTPRLPGDPLAPRKTVHSGVRHDWNGKDKPLSFSDARRCHWHEWHNRDWWCQHFNTIVLVGGGYYFLDAGYWYPALGYDPLNNYYDYDGPIYTYGNLLPDEVITNVQVALQDAGYYSGPITGSLDVETRAALANFQRDYGLPITGAIDQPTIETLGLY
jgi:Putative peptidoglycan binding domain